MDETLIKSVSDYNKFPEGLYDARVMLDDRELFVSYRPYLFETLKRLSKHFELILFTAGHRPYAEAVIK